MLLFQELIFPTWQEMLLLMPELQLTIFACFVLVLDLLLKRGQKRPTAYVSLIGIGITAISLWQLYHQNQGAMPKLAFYDMYIVDGFALAFKAICLIGAAFSIAISIKYLDGQNEQHGEFYSLVLFATVGMMLMSSGYDLLTLYVSLELMSISVYVLVGYLKRDEKSNEAALKYFLLGAFSSAILLYGISLIYGVTGQTNLQLVAEVIPMALGTTGDARYLLIMATILISAGLFFKIAAVPFHMWAPDAYEGAPTSISAFMSVGVKTASYALFARIFLVMLPDLRVIGKLPGWEIMLMIVAALTMTFGNLAAMTQNNTKRLLAYSSISHAGFVLLGIIAGNDIGYTGVVIYLLVYTLMNVGAFGVILALPHRDQVGEHIDDFNGLIYKNPMLAILMLIFLLSLAGIPATAGFIGKYFLFAGLIKAGNEWTTKLAVVAILNMVVSFYYYARIIKAMFTERISDDQPVSTDNSLKAALLIAAILTILIGVYPQPLIRVCQAAAKQVIPTKPNPAKQPESFGVDMK